MNKIITVILLAVSTNFLQAKAMEKTKISIETLSKIDKQSLLEKLLDTEQDWNNLIGQAIKDNLNLELSKIEIKSFKISLLAENIISNQWSCAVLCNYCLKREVKKRFKFCSICEKSRYCCEECQNLDWPNHKLNCCRFAQAEKAYEISDSDNKEREKTFVLIDEKANSIIPTLKIELSIHEQKLIRDRINEIGIFFYKAELLENLIEAIRKDNNASFSKNLHYFFWAIFLEKLFSEEIVQIQSIEASNFIAKKRIKDDYLPYMAYFNALECAKEKAKEFQKHNYGPEINSALMLLRDKLIKKIVSSEKEKSESGMENCNLDSINLYILGLIYNVVCQMSCIRIEKAKTLVMAIEDNDAKAALSCLKLKSILQTFRLSDSQVLKEPNLTYLLKKAYEYVDFELSQEELQELFYFITSVRRHCYDYVMVSQKDKPLFFCPGPHFHIGLFIGNSLDILVLAYTFFINSNFRIKNYPEQLNEALKLLKIKMVQKTNQFLDAVDNDTEMKNLCVLKTLYFALCQVNLIKPCLLKKFNEAIEKDNYQGLLACIDFKDKFSDNDFNLLFDLIYKNTEHLYNDKFNFAPKITFIGSPIYLMFHATNLVLKSIKNFTELKSLPDVKKKGKKD